MDENIAKKAPISTQKSKRHLWTQQDNQVFASVLQLQIDEKSIQWNKISQDMYVLGSNKSQHQCEVRYQSMLYSNQIICLSQKEQRQKVIEVLMQKTEKRNRFAWTSELRQQLTELYQKYKNMKNMWRNILLELKSDNPVTQNACREELLRLHQLQSVSDYNLQRKSQNNSIIHKIKESKKGREWRYVSDLSFINQLMTCNSSNPWVELCQKMNNQYTAKQCEQHFPKLQRMYQFYDSNDQYANEITSKMQQLSINKQKYLQFQQVDQFVDSILKGDNYHASSLPSINLQEYDQLFNDVMSRIAVTKYVFANLPPDLQIECLQLYKYTRPQQEKNSEQLKEKILQYIQEQIRNKHKASIYQCQISLPKSSEQINFSQFDKIFKQVEKRDWKYENKVIRFKYDYINKSREQPIKQETSDTTPQFRQYTVYNKNKGFTLEEHRKFLELFPIYGKKWAKLANELKTKSAKQCFAHYRCITKSSKSQIQLPKVTAQLSDILNLDRK